MSDGDLPSVFSVKIRQAHRIHKCCECHNEIIVGEKYQYAKGCWDGRWDNFKTCLPCSGLRDELARGSYDNEYPPFEHLSEWAHEEGIEFPVCTA